MSIQDKLNEATKLTEKREKEMIKSLEEEYNKAYKEMKQKLNSFIADYGVDGKLSETEAKKFGRLKKLIKNLETELKKVESLQTYQLKTYLKDSYELNYYYTGYALETESLVKLNYSILDRKQVANAINNPLMNIAIDDNKKQARAKLRRSLTQSVVQGEGIRDSAARIRKDLTTSSNRAVKIARTETTGIMGKSRQQSFEHAKARNIELKKVWVATLDGRTRDSHQSLDGETVDTDAAFSNGLMYPGDPSGPPSEVINCRCTEIAKLPDIDYSQRRITKTNELGEYKTFDEWKKDRLS